MSNIIENETIINDNKQNLFNLKYCDNNYSFSLTTTCPNDKIIKMLTKHVIALKNIEMNRIKLEQESAKNIKTIPYNEIKITENPMTHQTRLVNVMDIPCQTFKEW